MDSFISYEYIFCFKLKYIQEMNLRKDTEVICCQSTASLQ